mmetsp:Transcript_24443/g.58602  ORF Transcript_24443/g.58602 Transcript_24443/m.58602 type:complete len:215 (+) Transcript_24443:192-836(+)
MPIHRDDQHEYAQRHGATQPDDGCHRPHMLHWLAWAVPYLCGLMLACDGWCHVGGAGRGRARPDLLLRSRKARPGHGPCADGQRAGLQRWARWVQAFDYHAEKHHRLWHQGLSRGQLHGGPGAIRVRRLVCLLRRGGLRHKEQVGAVTFRRRLLCEAVHLCPQRHLRPRRRQELPRVPPRHLRLPLWHPARARQRPPRHAPDAGRGRQHGDGKG